MVWKSISKDKFLYLRGRCFYVRRRVPTELREAVGKEFLITSLKTSDFKEASRLATLVNADHQKLLDEIVGRSHPAENSTKFDDLSADAIENLVTSWFSNRYVAQANYFAGGDHYELDAEETEDEQELKERRSRRVREVQLLTLPDHPMHDTLLRGTINSIAERNGLLRHIVRLNPLMKRPELVANKKGWKYRFFFDLVRRATMELLRQEVEQIAEIPTHIRDADLQEAIQKPRHRGKRTVTLAELIEEFKSDLNRRDMRKKVELDYSLLFRVMDEVIGHDRRLRDIERDDCKAVRDLLLRLPANATKMYPGLTFSQAAEKGVADDRRILSPVTVNSYIHKMSALFNYAVVEERMDKNPARKLGIEGHEHSDEDRNPFSPAQLEKIFSAPIYTGCEDDGRNWSKAGTNLPKGTKFWVPLIGLYQGMRLNEICQLRVDDIKQEAGITFFDIKPDIPTGASQHTSTDEGSGRRTKTASSRRRVPLHPKLEEIGFLNFVEVQRNARKARLFSELRKDGRGYYSDGFQKWFSRFLDKQSAKENKTSFHSFRHNWANAMRLAGVPQERRRLIGGWKRTATDEKYGSDLPLTEIYNEIQKVDYETIKALRAFKTDK